MKIPKIAGLFYITHIENIPSILRNGILSHQRILDENIPFTPIYNEQIVTNRKDILTPNGKSLWNFTNVFFQPRNPMLYRVLHEKQASEIAIIAIQPTILDRPDIYFSTGNAAHSASDILHAIELKKEIRHIILDTVDVEWWNDLNGSKRKIMAECLIPDRVDTDLIQAIYVGSRAAKEKIEADNLGLRVPIITEPNMFFLPSRGVSLTDNLRVAEGDMFFSRMQTLTVSVNTVGIMGAGLASRAKYQFPDVYVYYQDLCRSRKLQMGKPRLYKREVSLEHELADDPSSLSNAQLEKWFLLFPTKQHWRNRADMNGIEEGLRWLVSNYKKEGIKSLAIPALGCGLGKLEWRDLGPLMCAYLRTMDITVSVYVPTEHRVPDQELTRDFLLA